MSIDINDPKLTAYVLGELSQADRAAVEQVLSANAGLRAEVDAVRDMATQLQAELATEPMPVLPSVRVFVPSSFKPALRRFAIATSLLVAVATASYVAPRVDLRDGELTFAKHTESQSLPSPIWASDDVQYFPTGPDMKVERKAQAQQTAPDADASSTSPSSQGGAQFAARGTAGRITFYDLPNENGPSDNTRSATSNGSGGAAFTARRSAEKLPHIPDSWFPPAGRPPESSPPTATITGDLANGDAIIGLGKHSDHGGKGDRPGDDLSGILNPTRPSVSGLASGNGLDTIYGPTKVQGGGANSIGILQLQSEKQAEQMGQGGGQGDHLASILDLLEPRSVDGSKADTSLDIINEGTTVDGLAKTKSQDRHGGKFFLSNVPPQESPGTESYAPIPEQGFIAIRDKQTALSTFSIDVDTASYSNVRRFLESGQLPPADAVRVEELVNDFKYDYPQPEGDVPFSVNLEVAGCPWQPEHRLVRVGLKGREIPRDKRPASNLVFLLDVSGSMQPENKLPLVKQSMKLLVEQLTENDRVAIVTYAGEAGLKLASTTAAEKEKIIAAIDSLTAGGSTNGEGGLRLAYDAAVQNRIPGGTNRVILATDGDFNVGLSSDADMEALITEKAATGVFLTAIGVGMGNLKDSKLERLADKGNGNYAYIDKPSEAHKVFVEQLAGTLVTIAKDVKIQVEFNPATVRAHRLIGYENRRLAHKDFNDDRKDAGEIGAGHAVTALYEIVPAVSVQVAAAPGVDRLRYQVDEPPVPLTDAAKSGELMVVKLRYKQPDGSESKLIETAVKDSGRRFYEASGDFKFAAAVATFALRLRQSQYRGSASFALALELAQSALTRDESGHRREFVDLVTRAKQLASER